ncbi:hypothetical protein [Neorhodopirellula pilleata]|uniref:Uncharacterized protein n=1 Tax=Neorhodopirellula pilleata TaxID=2714738 RepID=A0A5C6A418_9BACT|nr:hypothetical protein [Neorhodopirellula pilleata]TWT94239.1 hypothetical protein Pla100_38490 [Neorhodopirellula pilleata]
MNSRPAEAVLQESYLETRAKLLEVAAVLDRIDRAASTSRGSLPADSVQARQKLIGAIEILLQNEPDRAERIQQLFSRPYASDWRSQFGLEKGGN